MAGFAGAATPLTGDALDAAAAMLEVSPLALWAVAVVESGGVGFLPDRRPKLLFERRLFRKLTGGAFDSAHPQVSGGPGGYGAGGAHQYDRLAVALALDRTAALQSSSWGIGQTLGLNHRKAGFPDVEAMIAAYRDSEAAQLLGMTRFIASEPRRTRALGKLDWTAFARLYNGAAYAENRYDERLAAAHAALISRGLPDWRLRADTLRPAPAPAQER